MLSKHLIVRQKVRLYGLLPLHKIPYMILKYGIEVIVALSSTLATKSILMTNALIQFILIPHCSMYILVPSKHFLVIKFNRIYFLRLCTKYIS